jgi:hypothetical protein
MSGVNPVYTLAESAFAEGLKSYYICFFSLKEHETALFYDRSSSSLFGVG